MTRRWIAALAVSLAAFGSRAADYYVDAAAGDDAWTGLCATWDGAACGPKLTIAAAMAAAQDGDTVIIRPGLYRGDGNRDLDFGGKAIVVQCLDPEDPEIVDQTVMDCEGTTQAPHRAFKFIRGEGVDSQLAGLTIQNGRSPPYYQPDFSEIVYWGGAILCQNSGPTLYRCVIQDCLANIGGAIVAERSTGLTLVRCTLRRNKACFLCTPAGTQFVPVGGAVSAWGGGPVKLLDCTMAENVVGDRGGGGAGLSATSPDEIPIHLELTNCTFESNHILGASRGTSSGGAVSIRGLQTLTSEYVYVSGCRFRHNSVPPDAMPPPPISSRGGALVCSGDRLELVIENSSFESNSAPYGGATYVDCEAYAVRGCLFGANIANQYPALYFTPPTSLSVVEHCTIAGHLDTDGPASSLGGAPGVTNCIFWNDAIREFSLSNTPIIEYTDIKGGWAGTGNIDADPLFVDPANGDYHLSPGSPCINAGDPAASGAGQTDIDGQARVWGGRIDMGADESGSFAFGDLNCDGTVNTFDINGFLQALSDPAQYALDHPACDAKLADADVDGSVNQFDVQAFVGLLGG